MTNERLNLKVLRMKDLTDKVGYKPSTIYDLISKGQFPAPMKLVPNGRAIGWFESTIDEWLWEIANRNSLNQSNKDFKE